MAVARGYRRAETQSRDWQITMRAEWEWGSEGRPPRTISFDYDGRSDMGEALQAVAGMAKVACWTECSKLEVTLR